MNAPSEKRTVLVVDDDRDIRLTLAEILEDEGYNVQIASNGREALEVLGRNAEPVSLIVLDLMMPEMDGFEFREAQLRDKRISEIPVVALTAWGSGDVPAMPGVAGCFSKPLELDALLSLVSRFTTPPEPKK